MKSRHVIVTLELDTAEKVATLRNKDLWQYAIDVSGCLKTTIVKQVQVNVVKPEKGGKQP